MECPNCTSQNCIKKGKRQERQRYCCNDCGRYFQDSYRYRAYDANTDSLIIRLLKEGSGIRSIARLLGIATGTVLSRMLSLSMRLRIPPLQGWGATFEIDELWAYTGNKDNVTWVTYAIDRESRQVVGLHVGNKSKETIRPLIDKILITQPRRIYTDRLNIYPSLIPSEIHKVFRHCTNRIERMNLTLRTHIKRLSRRTLCFSKSARYLEAHLRIYFWG